MNIVKNFVLCKTGTALFQTALCCILIGIGFGFAVPAVGQSHPTRPILYNILMEERSKDVSKYRIATPQEWQQLKIIRRGVFLNVTLPMALKTGDRIKTGPSLAAAIRFPNGSQLYLRSNSHIKIGSVFAFFGELFVRVKGAFQVDTEFVTAGAEGTEWVMRVAPNGDTRCTVLEGRVRVASRENFWGPMSMIVNRQNVTRGSRYTEMISAPQGELNEMKRWIGQIDQLAREPPQSPTPDDHYNRPSSFHFYFNPPDRRTYRHPEEHEPSWTD